MRAILATLNRELHAYFFSPLAYAVLAFFLVVNGIVFALIVSYMNNPMVPAGRPLDFFFGGFFFWLVLLFVAPVLTMRLISEERRSGSIEVLMTAPVTETQVVLGKYLAALAFYVCLWLPTLAYVGVVAYYSEVDWGPIGASYLGVLGIGALFLAAGTFASAMSRNQIVAALFTFALLIVFFAPALLQGLATGEAAKQVVGYLDLVQHLDDLKKGIVDTRRLVYYLSTTVFLLFVTSRALAAKKWR